MKPLAFLSCALALSLVPNLAAQKGRQLSGQHAPATTPALSPGEAQKKFTVPEGFQVRLFASEPDVINPVAMTWDDRGRLWVVELYEYPLGAPKGTKPRDRVVILEDTDGDGRADKRTVFADGLNLATAILCGYGGVFVGQAPDLYFFEDTDGDDVADKKTTVLTGFGLEDRHELLNGFTWGPDGWLYMTHGVFTLSKVKNPDDPNDDGAVMNGAVARFHPRTKKFEVFADGTSNPWGVDFDRHGNAFISACVIDHMFHMAPAGLYVRQAGSPPNPYGYELIPSIVDHKHFRAAYAGIQVYLGDQYPAEYQGTVLMGNIHDSAVHQDRLTPRGSSFTSTFIKDFVRANDGWFRPVSVQTGPDGAVWLMDWYDKYPCYQNANADPEGVDRERGRIWRVVYTGDKTEAKIPSRPNGLSMAKLATSDLVKELNHPNVWRRRMAQRILSEKADKTATAPLLELLKSSPNADTRLASLWTLHGAQALDESTLNQYAADSDPGIRTWVARLTGERKIASQAALSRLVKLAADPDPSVRLAVAVACRQFTSGSLTVNTPTTTAQANIWPALAAISSQPQSAADPLIPFMVWMAMEPQFGKESKDFLAAMASSDPNSYGVMQSLIKKAMRRICDMRSPEELNKALAFLDGLPESKSDLITAALDGLIEGQKGKALAPSQSPAALLAKLGNHPDAEVKSRSQRLGTLWGDATALNAILAKISAPGTSEEEKIQSIQSIKQQKSDVVREFLLKVASTEKADRVLQETFRALSEVGGDNVAGPLLQNWKNYSVPVRRTGAEVLVSRPNWLRSFLTAIENKDINPKDLPTPVLRSIMQNKDEKLRERAQKAIGRFRESDADKLKLIADKKLVVLNGTVDLKAGHELVQKNCLTCHKLHGEGADIGPDLTGVGRSSLDALLANVIDPNQIIGKGYENVLIETKDGRNISGRVVEDNDSRVKIVSAGPKEEVVAKSEIASMTVSEMSVMPEGLEQMSDADFRNMIWYVLNPPQDDKPIEVRLDDKKLVVRSKLSNQPGSQDLVTYVTSHELRPYLHPVKDPGGKIVMTQDKPSDHVWQHGFFTGLHKVNGIDFWTEREGKQRFVKLLDVTQEQDRVGWRSLTEWVAPNGEVILEEEQSITVFAPTSEYYYLMDFDWTLRAGKTAVKIGAHDYGGFAIRLDYSPEHHHLNSNGEKDGATSDKRAAWCNVSRNFEGQTLGVAVFDHPQNPGHPAKWRVDGQGLINPSPSLQGDWSIAPDKETTFRYRIAVHTGSGEAQYFEPTMKSYSALRFASAGELHDGESVALWNPEWKLDCPEFEGAPKKFPTYLGKKNVLMTHPYSPQKAAGLERWINVPAGKQSTLTFFAAAHESGNWDCRVLVDGKKIWHEAIKNESGWKEIQADLTLYAGKKVLVRLENVASDWNNEFAFWHDIQLR